MAQYFTGSHIPQYFHRMHEAVRSNQLTNHEWMQKLIQFNFVLIFNFSFFCFNKEKIFYNYDGKDLAHHLTSHCASKSCCSG